MEDLKKPKGCLVDAHSEECITMLCIDPNCTNISRCLCVECILQPSHNHKQCKHLLSFNNYKEF